MGLLTACAAPSGGVRVTGHGLEALAAEAPPRGSAPHPVLAFALGGGGLRGYAHLGVLHALEEAGIRPDIVVGTSVGAIVGAAYAAGASPAALWQQVTTMRLMSLADVTLLGPGVIKGDALARWANDLVGHLPIERFPLRFAAVASDLNRAEPIAITSGDAGQAARASAAIPGVFLPVAYEDGELVDGGVTALVPVRVARALGADLVIAVDIYCHGPRYSADSVLTTLFLVSQTQSCLLADAELAEADVVIAPPVGPAGIDDAKSREEARDLGYTAAKAVLPAIKALLQRH